MVQLAYLVSCMVVDYRVYDRSVVEVLLGRLHASRNREMLIGLLRFCRDHKDLTTVRNLAHLWARTADWMACDIGNTFIFFHFLSNLILIGFKT